jgi:hypothetical protein
MIPMLSTCPGSSNPWTGSCWQQGPSKIFKTPAGEYGLSESGEKEKPSRIHLLRQMLLNGVDEQAAALTLIPGVGAKWVRKLMRAGIANLPDLAVCPLSRLEELGGLSRKRALKWLALAPELLEAQPGRTDSVLAPFFRAKPQGLDLKVDPYRLRRALELSVELWREAWSHTQYTALRPSGCGAIARITPKVRCANTFWLCACMAGTLNCAQRPSV